MPLTNLPLVNQGLQRFVPEMQYRVSLIEPSGAREEPTGYYRPPTHEEITNRLSRITQPGRRDFIVRPKEPGVPAAGRFGVPPRRDFITQPVRSELIPETQGRFGLGNATAITWQGAKAPVVAYERNAVMQGFAKLNYFAAPDFSVYESAIIEGTVKFALKHYLYGASMITRSPDKQSTPLMIPSLEFTERVRAAIGLCRFLFSNWSGFGYRVVDTSGNIISNWWDDRLAWISYVTQWWPPSL